MILNTVHKLEDKKKPTDLKLIEEPSTSILYSCSREDAAAAYLGILQSLCSSIAASNCFFENDLIMG